MPSVNHVTEVHLVNARKLILFIHIINNNFANIILNHYLHCSRDLERVLSVPLETEDTTRNQETTPILENTIQLPESPPPPYVTPPGTILRNYGMTGLSGHNIIRKY